MKETPLPTPSDFAGTLTKLLSELHRPVAGALMSFAVYEAAEGREFISGRLLLCEHPQTPRDALRYEAVSLAEEWVPAERIPDFVAALARGTLSGGDVTASATFTELSLIRDVAMHSNVSGWPEWRGILKTSGRLRDYPRDDVVRFGLPPYRSIAHAANEWIFRHPRNADSNSVTNQGQLIIAVPDTRGRLVRADWVGGTVSVTRESHSEDDRALQLQVRFVGNVQDQPELITPCPAEIQRPVPEGTESIFVYLVHREAGLLADRSIGSFQRQREQPSVEVLTLEAEVERDLSAGGENEFVEYKPFIKLQDPKEDELERSLVAFANAGGGRLYIGATDEGVPLGARALRNRPGDHVWRA